MVVAAATRVVCLSALCLCVGVRGFYIPGVAPTENEEGDKLEIKVRFTVSWDGLADGAGVMNIEVNERGGGRKTMYKAFSYLPFLLVRPRPTIPDIPASVHGGSGSSLRHFSLPAPYPDPTAILGEAMKDGYIPHNTYSLLTCSLSPDCVAHPLTPDQKMWLDESKSDSKKKSTAVPPLSVSGERPTLTELVKIRLPSRVGPKSLAFGTLLLQDDFGDKVANISECCRGDPERITMGILREWLAGKGVEVSWESLIATLRDSELSLLADQIPMALDQLRS